MKGLKYIRIAVYIFILLGLLYLKFTDDTLGSCYIKSSLGISCPTCGITRATKALLDFNFSTAVHQNAYFIFVLLPLFTLFLFDDIICMIRKRTSLVDIILRPREKGYSFYCLLFYYSCFCSFHFMGYFKNVLIKLLEYLLIKNTPPNVRFLPNIWRCISYYY